jgi:hypothetical protein
MNQQQRTQLLADREIRPIEGLGSGRPDWPQFELERDSATEKAIKAVVQEISSDLEETVADRLTGYRMESQGQ